MKDRVIPCEFYICKGKCSKDRDAEFWGICQTCPKYQPKKGAAPARVDTRRKKKAKAERKERWDD